MKILLLTVIAVMTSVSMVSAVDYYVSTTGNDKNPGTQAAPWRTVQKAAASVPAGSTVYIRGGIYRERVQITARGTAAARIVFRSAPDEMAVLDAAGLELPSYEAPIIRMMDRDYVTLQDLELRNCTTTNDQTIPMGILVEGSGTGIEIRNCRVHDIQQNNAVKNNSDANAHGIAFYGGSKSPLTAVVVDNCELWNLRLGASEALVLNGNVTGFTVTNNRVHDCNNIGIDFIGYEGTCKDPAQDRARNGVCAGNKVWNIDSYFNPAYGGHLTKGGGDRSADGIYVDGGADIVIERNEVWAANIGVELASEHEGRATERVTLRDNVIRHCLITGISLGGYDENRGAAIGCSVINNTLVANDTTKSWSGQLQLQWHVSRCSIRNNIFQANTSTRQMIAGEPPLEAGNVIDFNLYACDTARANNLEFDLGGRSYGSLASWQKATGFDTHSIFAIPGFVSAGANNFSLAATSAAIDRGDPAMKPVPGEKDFSGGSRLNGKRIDIGADEFGTN